MICQIKGSKRIGNISSVIQNVKKFNQHLMQEVKENSKLFMPKGYFFVFSTISKQGWSVNLENILNIARVEV
jgi:hypothetical protein